MRRHGAAATRCTSGTDLNGASSALMTTAMVSAISAKKKQNRQEHGKRLLKEITLERSSVGQRVPKHRKARCRWEQFTGYWLSPLPPTSLRPLLRPLNYLTCAVPPRRRRGETKCAAQLVSMPSCGLPKKTSQKGEKAPKKVR